jgi:hypothetical protein
VAAILVLLATTAHGQWAVPARPLPTIQKIPSQVFFELTTNQSIANQSIANQSGDGPLYTGRGNGYSVFLSKREVALVVPSSVDPKTKRPSKYQTVRLVFDSGSDSLLMGIDELEGKSNYFSGSNPDLWRRNVPHFGKVLYKNVYSGIDLIFYSRDGQLEFDYAVHPGANPGSIHFKTVGGETSLSPAGDLVIRAGGRNLVTIKKPEAYQEAGERREVPVRYTRQHDEVALDVSQYDRTLPLIVDPALIFSTYITSNCLTNCEYTVNALAADASGVYLGGNTIEAPFPSTANSPQATTTNGPELFAIKLDPTGSHIIYADFFSSSNFSVVGLSTIYSVSVDSSGAAYLAGMATVGFPTTPGAFITTQEYSVNICSFANNCLDPFAMKITPDGSTIVYSTFLQAPYPDGKGNQHSELLEVASAAVDSNGDLYIVGTAEVIECFGGTFSDPPSGILMPLAVTSGAVQSTRPGAVCNNAFVMKLNPSGSGLDFATYLGGPNSQQAVSVAVGSNGTAYVAGNAGAGYPTTPGAYQTTFTGTTTYGSTGFVTNLSADGSSFLYSTYWPIPVNGIGVDPLGEAVIAPAIGKLNPAGSALVYSNPLPGVTALAVAVDSTGAAYVTGYQTSGSFPLIDPIQQYSFVSEDNQIIAKLDTSGNLVWSTFFGGLFPINASSGVGIAADPGGDVYVLGQESPTPVTPGAFDSTAQLPPNNFLAKIAPSLGSPVPGVFTSFIAFGNEVVGVPSTPQYVTIGNFGDAPLPPPTISVTGDFTQTNTCSNPVPPAQNCFATITFNPTTTGNRTGTLTISYGGSYPPQTVQFSGAGLAPQVNLSLTSLVFPPQPIGTMSTLMQVTITNGGTGALATSSVSVTGDFAQTNTCSAPVQVNGICIVQVTFTPTAQGFRTGTLTITDNAPGSPQAVSLEGYGGSSTSATLNPGSVAFSSQAVGITSASQAVTFSNTGAIALAIASISSSGDFAESNTCGSSVAAGGSCQISITFTPTASGTRTGAVQIIDNATQSPQSIALSGTGAAANLGLGVPAGGSSSLTLQAGASGSYTLTIGGAGISGTASLSCTGAPSGATCSAPATVTLTANSASTVTVSVTTTARTISGPSSRHLDLAPLSAPLALGMIAAGMAFAKRRSVRIGWACLFPLVGLCACGGGGSSSSGPTSPSGTPAGNYQLVVTAASGSATQTATLTLTVQ